MNLVIQSPAPLADDPLAALRATTSLPRPVRIDPHAVRYENASQASRDAVSAFCEPAGLDLAWVPARAFSSFRLLAMDMDSTLITIECIDEIAAYCGLKKEVAEITEAAMRGEIADFSESLRRRVALLEGLDAGALERVYSERLQLSPGADALLAAARESGLRTLLVSGGFTYFTERLQARLGLDTTRANTLEVVGNRLTGKVLGEIVDAKVKARTLLETCAALHIDPADAVAIGDGSNDLAMMGAAGLSVAFRAKPVVRAAATVALNHVGLEGVPRLFV